MHAILHCANINILFWEGHAAELNSKLKSEKKNTASKQTKTRLSTLISTLS
jgi:hypothetical protein